MFSTPGISSRCALLGPARLTVRLRPILAAIVTVGPLLILANEVPTVGILLIVPMTVQLTTRANDIPLFWLWVRRPPTMMWPLTSNPVGMLCMSAVAGILRSVLTPLMTWVVGLCRAVMLVLVGGGGVEVSGADGAGVVGAGVVGVGVVGVGVTGVAMGSGTAAALVACVGRRVCRREFLVGMQLMKKLYYVGLMSPWLARHRRHSLLTSYLPVLKLCREAGAAMEVSSIGCLLSVVCVRERTER